MFENSSKNNNNGRKGEIGKFHGKMSHFFLFRRNIFFFTRMSDSRFSTITRWFSIIFLFIFQFNLRKSRTKKMNAPVSASYLHVHWFNEQQRKAKQNQNSSYVDYYYRKPKKTFIILSHLLGVSFDPFFTFISTQSFYQ